MKFAITIPTYKRLDGTTPQYLTRALNSIINQSYQDYKVFLIGDAYDDNDEFIQLATSMIPNDKLYYENLPVAIERNKYNISSRELWCSGGVNCRNHAIDLVLQDNLEYVCPLDHDDYWHPTHLEQIMRVIQFDPDTSFVYTCSTYFDTHLPTVELSNNITHSIPQPGGVIHSSTCINYKKIPLMYRDVFAETGIIEPSDADLWRRLGSYIIQHNLSSYLVSSLTCFHPKENQ